MSRTFLTSEEKVRRNGILTAWDRYSDKSIAGRKHFCESEGITRGNLSTIRKWKRQLAARGQGTGMSGERDGSCQLVEIPVIGGSASGGNSPIRIRLRKSSIEISDLASEKTVRYLLRALGEADVL